MTRAVCFHESSSLASCRLLYVIDPHVLSVQEAIIVFYACFCIVYPLQEASACLCLYEIPQQYSLLHISQDWAESQDNYKEPSVSHSSYYIPTYCHCY